MSYLTDVKQVYGGTCISEYYDVSPICFYFSNTHLQGFSPRGGTICDGFHGPLKAMNYVDAGHSLEDLGELYILHGVILLHRL